VVTSKYLAIWNCWANRNMKSPCIAVECSVVICCRRLVSCPALIQVSTHIYFSIISVFRLLLFVCKCDGMCGQMPTWLTIRGRVMLSFHGLEPLMAVTAVPSLLEIPGYLRFFVSLQFCQTRCICYVRMVFSLCSRELCMAYVDHFQAVTTFKTSILTYRIAFLLNLIMFRIFST
jgi:hypothetical protein